MALEPLTQFEAPATSRPEARPVGYLVKRVFDVIVVAGLLLVAIPLMLLVAVLIRFTSRGPVLYRQVRLMQGGREFTLWKFRTMVDGADELLDSVLHLNHASLPLFKSRSDPRLTAVGSFLRRYYLDELPQLFNVLSGHMSLVGPRPCLPLEFASHRDILAFRFSVPQGLTGPWQTKGYHAMSLEERVEVERAYIDGWSLGRDLAILLETLPLVVGGRGL